MSLDGGGYAMVHLTWSQETDPRWPVASLFESLTEWRDGVMIPRPQGMEDVGPVSAPEPTTEFDRLC